MNQNKSIIQQIKRSGIFIATLFAFPMLLMANSIEDLSEKEIMNLLCSGKWHLSYMEMDGQHIDFPDNEVQANWTVFNSDGTHQSEEMGESYGGTWEYNHSSKTLTTNDKDGKVDLVIVKIDGNELKVTLIDQGKEMMVGMKK